jgi:hypothetical protein
MAAVTRGRDAIEEIDSPRNPLQQVGGKADPHKITGDLPGQPGLQQFQDSMHHRLGFTHRQAANGNAGPRAPFQGSLQRADSQLVVDAALEDGP